MADHVKVVTRNKKARHDYEILETVEAGMVLLGSEIKSIRAGRVNIVEGFVRYQRGEMWLHNVHIATYDEAGVFGHEPLRPRKLLLHKKEIIQLQSKVDEKRLTLIPMQLYLKNGRAKLELALARGMKKYDKRESLRRKDDKRRMERAIKERF